MKHFLLFVLILLNISVFGQEFPADWIGTYEGNMILGNIGRPNDTIPVTFEMQEIEKDSIWSYIMTFNSERFGKIVKDYRIIAKSKDSKTNYLLDEQNGIVMEESFMNGTFYGIYEVMDVTYISTLRFLGEDLFIELIGASLKKPTVSATEDDPETEENEAIEAKSYKPMLHQSVLLKRVQ